ncbi:aspartate carbamoyltransferase [candidate division TA06 bacterium DG_26]|uniref:Aspartate carbamoyltransferase n=1 Tax=candidate division TA06 bacterium DG_26 TaxID=1703771 RepID=A0A0S7WIR4_UNCT6|nr:MAG: aspartate carbamoyltransferase [candidate division TA06 bacterium DG_26]
MRLNRKDLLGLEQLSKEEIELFLDTATSLREVSERPIRKVPTLRGKTIVNLFLEASTRTKSSFELAAKRLSADTVNISAASSSILKGETLLDTARNLEAMKIDAVVVRHSSPGAAVFLARKLAVPVINGGDGIHEHPTQGLLDLLTIRDRKGRIEGLQVAIVGDIAHSRVARSDIFGLSKLGADVRVCGPPTLIPRDIERLGVGVHHELRKALREVDVVIVLRIQREREKAGVLPSIREYRSLFMIDKEALSSAREDVLVMHPGPINRGVELDPEVADSTQSAILAQVTNGIAVRMAVLYLLIGSR